MIKRVITLLITSGLAAKLVRHLIQRQQTKRTVYEGRRQRDDLNRWEDEGGNLPPSGSRRQRAAPRRNAAR